MKKLLWLALFCLAAVARAQVTLHTFPTSADTYPLDGNAANGLSNVVGPWCAGTTPAAGDIIYWSTASGGCWADLPVGSNGQILTVTSALPAWAAAAGGSAFSAITSGTNTAATMTCGTGCSITTSGSGTNTATATTSNAVTNAMLAQGAANTVVGVAGNATANRGDIAPGTTAPVLLPQSLTYDGTNTAFTTAPYDLTKWDIINTSFWQHCSAATPAVINSMVITGTGTAAGCVTTPALASDANHPNLAEITTGSTNAGTAVLGIGLANTVNGLVLSGNEVIDWLIYVPVASGTTNTFRVSAGWWDAIGTAAPANAVFITWDNNSNTHWAVESCKASTCTGPTASTTVATAAAWHHLTIVVNSNATSIAYYVDGTQLSSSPLTTNIPTSDIYPQVRIQASAGCASAPTCVMDINTLHYQKPVSR